MFKEKKVEELGGELGPVVGYARGGGSCNRLGFEFLDFCFDEGVLLFGLAEFGLEVLDFLLLGLAERVHLVYVLGLLAEAVVVLFFGNH